MGQSFRRAIAKVAVAALFASASGCYNAISMRPVVYEGTVVEMDVTEGRFLAVSVVDSTMVWATLERETLEGNLKMYLLIKNFRSGKLLFDPSQIMLRTIDGDTLRIWTAEEWMKKKITQDGVYAYSSAKNNTPYIPSSHLYDEILLRANTLSKDEISGGYLWAKYKRSTGYYLEVPVGREIHRIYFSPIRSGVGTSQTGRSFTKW